MRNSQTHNNALRLTNIQTQKLCYFFLYIIIFTLTHKVKNKGNRKKIKNKNTNGKLSRK